MTKLLDDKIHELPEVKFGLPTFEKRVFYFKVHDYKLNPENYTKLEHQIQLVIDRLSSRFNFNSYEIQTGTVNDDYVKQRFRLRVSFECIRNKESPTN